MVWIMPTITILSTVANLPKSLFLSKNSIKGIRVIKATVPLSGAVARSVCGDLRHRLRRSNPPETSRNRETFVFTLKLRQRTGSGVGMSPPEMNAARC